MLSISGYSLLTEKNSLKSRSGIYIKSSIKFTRRADLEGVDNSLVIIDIELSSKYRLINLYRVFNPQNGISQKNYFISQLNKIKIAIENKGNHKLILLGDFNLDEMKKYQDDYSHKSYYELLDKELGDYGLVQLVDTWTWSRLVNGVWRMSTLDHICYSSMTYNL